MLGSARLVSREQLPSSELGDATSCSSLRRNEPPMNGARPIPRLTRGRQLQIRLRREL